MGDKNVLELGRVDGCTQVVHVINASELYNFKWLISCYMNFTSILKIIKVFK